MAGSRPRLTASWEATALEGGLGDPCLHVDLRGSPAAALVRLVGPHLCEASEAEGTARVRVEPSVSLDAFAALLRGAGWRVEEVVPGRVVTAEGPAASARRA